MCTQLRLGTDACKTQLKSVKLVTGTFLPFFPLIPYLTYTNRDGKRDLTTTFSFVYFYLKCPAENAGNGISEALKFRSP